MTVTTKLASAGKQVTNFITPLMAELFPVLMCILTEVLWPGRFLSWHPNSPKWMMPSWWSLMTKY
ncbi:Uncharacterised protein [Mycobacterium tuberculosis]|nr:Uncharacterised protein [Mycobacterium tuberculosis]